MYDDHKFPRSKDTRARILASARRQFGSLGFERTTIRAVAAEAAIDASMVMRYFGSKEGLFAAAVSFSLELPDLDKVPRRKVGEVLARHFVEHWEDPEGRENLPALLRTAATDASVRKRLQAVFTKQLRPGIARVAGPEREAEAVALVMCTLLGIAYSRYVLRLQPIVRSGPEAIIRSFAPTLQAQIFGR